MVVASLWDSTVHFPVPVEIAAYVALWIVALAGLAFVFQRGRRAGFNMRWTTQDVLILAIMGVLLEVYDNLIGDQFVTPIISLVPFGHLLAFNDLPYMFLLMVGIALIRKPGVATALVFLNFLLMQLLYPGSESSPLFWLYGVFQGLFVDIYFVSRGRRVFARANGVAVLDGLVMGALRAVPAVTVASALIFPLFTGETKTFGYIVVYSLLNMLGNGVEAAISAPLAIRIAQSVNQTTGNEAAERAVAASSQTPPVQPMQPMQQTPPTQPVQ